MPNNNNNDDADIEEPELCNICSTSPSAPFDTRCESCIAEHEHEEEYDEEQDDDYGDGYINSYSYKPRLIFHDSASVKKSTPTKSTHPPRNGRVPTIPYIGVELEVEAPEFSGSTGGVASRVLSIGNGLFYIKEDCSLNHGFEIVSHPMSFEFIRNNFNIYARTLQYLRSSGYKSWNTSTCGGHVHISKSAFRSISHEAKFVYFQFTNHNDMIDFVGRNSEHYAPWDMDIFVGYYGSAYGPKYSILDVLKGDAGEAPHASPPAHRNCAINRSNPNTHELRYFRPSLRADTMRAYYEFIECLFNFSYVISAPDAMGKNGAGGFHLLKEYAKGEKKYECLIERIDSRVTFSPRRSS